MVEKAKPDSQASTHISESSQQREAIAEPQSASSFSSFQLAQQRRVKPETILQLQRQIGNRATGQYLSKTLSPNTPVTLIEETAKQTSSDHVETETHALSQTIHRSAHAAIPAPQIMPEVQSEDENSEHTNSLLAEKTLSDPPTTPAISYSAGQTTTFAPGGQRVQRGLVDTITGNVSDVLGTAGAWATQIAAILANPLLAILSGLWLQLPDQYKPPLINKILDVATAILEQMQGKVSAVLGFLWPLIRSGLLAYFQRMREVDDDTKIAMSNRIAQIVSGNSLTFILYFVKGLALSVWDVIRSPYDLVVGIIDGVKMVTSFLKSLTSEDLTNAFQLIQNGLSAAWDGLMQLVQTPSLALQFVQTIWASVQQVTAQIGRGIADAILSFYELPDAEMGEESGRFSGGLIVDTALSALLPAIGGALRRALTTVQQFMHAFRLGTRSARLIEMVRSTIQPIMDGANRIGELFRDGPFGEWLEKFRSFINRMMGSADEAMTNLTRSADGHPEIDASGPREPDLDMKTPAQTETPGDASRQSPSQDLNEHGDAHMQKDADQDSPTPDDGVESNPEASPVKDTDQTHQTRADDDNFQRNLAAVRLRLGKMLMPGVSNIHLTQTLASMRIQYGFKRLHKEGQAKKSDIVVQRMETTVQNDVVSLNDVMDKYLGDILREEMETVDTDMLREIGLETILDERTSKAREAILDQRAEGLGTSKKTPIDTRGAGDLSARLGVAQDNMVTGRHTGFEHHIVGSVPRARKPALLTAASDMTGEQGTRVPSLFQVTGGTYEALMNELTELKSTLSLNDQEIGAALLSLARTGTIPGAILSKLCKGTKLVKHANVLARVMEIHFDTEMARSFSAVVTAPMLIEHLAAGEISLDEVFDRASSINPMTDKGINKAQFAMDRRFLKKNNLNQGPRSLQDAPEGYDHVDLRSDFGPGTTSRHGPTVFAKEPNRTQQFDPKSGMVLSKGEQGKIDETRRRERAFLMSEAKRFIPVHLSPMDLQFSSEVEAQMRLRQEVKDYLQNRFRADMRSETRRIVFNETSEAVTGS